MKLTPDQIKQVEKRTRADLIAEDHPFHRELVPRYGDHSFFLDEQGPHICEPTLQQSESCVRLAAVRLASRHPEAKGSLIQEPEPIIGETFDVTGLHMETACSPPQGTATVANTRRFPGTN